MQQRPERKRPPQLVLLLAGVGLGAALTLFLRTADNAAATTNSKTKAPATASAKPSIVKPAVKPLPVPPQPAGFEQMSQLAFLTGNWVGHLQAMPIFMDITINGAAEQTGGPIKFKIKATPPANSFVKLGLEGEYNAVAAYSTTQKAVRAIVTDVSGHGVEMLGEPDSLTEGKPPAWLFNSTAQGAPFPFKVRVTSVTADQILVNYSSGGRMPLTYEVTFNRVTG